MLIRCVLHWIIGQVGNFILEVSSEGSRVRGFRGSRVRGSSTIESRVRGSREVGSEEVGSEDLVQLKVGSEDLVQSKMGAEIRRKNGPSYTY